jgi:hypothetical protein
VALREVYNADKERAKAINQELTARESELIVKYKGKRTPASAAACESDLKQIGVMTGMGSTDYRDDPGFLEEARGLYCEFFRKLTGQEPAPWRPVGPTEMYRRNEANMEFCSTALYYCPGPDDDHIMCCFLKDDGEKECSFSADHYRDKVTHEIIGYRNSSAEDGDESKKKWRPIRFDYEEAEARRKKDAEEMAAFFQRAREHPDGIKAGMKEELDKALRKR